MVRQVGRKNLAKEIRIWLNSPHVFLAAKNAKRREEKKRWKRMIPMGNIFMKHGRMFDRE
jgi:hypothetical protein